MSPLLRHRAPGRRTPRGAHNRARPEIFHPERGRGYCERTRESRPCGQHTPPSRSVCMFRAHRPVHDASHPAPVKLRPEARVRPQK